VCEEASISITSFHYKEPFVEWNGYIKIHIFSLSMQTYRDILAHRRPMNTDKRTDVTSTVAL